MNKPNQINYFLVGSRRSGTTLLRLMLDNHKDVYHFGEAEFLSSQFDSDGNIDNFKQYLKYLKSDRIFSYYKFSDLSKNHNYNQFIRNFAIQLRKKSKKKIVGLTIHPNFSLLAQHFESKFIFIIRDPRDVSESFLKFNWAHYPEFSVNEWLSSYRELKNLKKTSANIHFVQYESLIRNPKEELTKINEFLGLPYCEDQLNYPDNSTYSKPDASMLNQWKNRSSKKNLIIESLCHKEMLEMNYEISSTNAAQINFLKKYKTKKRIMLKNERIFLFLKRIRSGGVLAILEFITRKFRLNKLHHKTMLAINNTAETKLK